MNVLSLCSGTGAADLGHKLARRIPPTLTNGIDGHSLDAWYAVAFLTLYRDLLEGLTKETVDGRA